MTTTITKTFYRELGLVIFIVLNALMVQMHLLADASHSNLYLFGKEVFHGYMDNQHFFWGLLTALQPLLLISLLYCKIEFRFKYAFLFLQYWLIYSLLNDLLMENIGVSEKTLQILSILLVLLFFGFTIKNEKRAAIFKPIDKKDFFITLIVIALPLYGRILFDVLKSMLLFVFQTSFGWPDIDGLIFTLIVKSYYFVPLLIFFFTLKQWWRYALLFPILLVVYQIKSIFDDSTQYIDEHEIITALPWLLTVLILLVFLSRAAYFQSKIAAIYQSTYQRIETAIKNRVAGDEKRMVTESEEKFNELKKGNAQSLKELEELKRTLSNALRKSDSSKKDF